MNFLAEMEVEWFTWFKNCDEERKTKPIFFYFNKKSRYL